MNSKRKGGAGEREFAGFLRDHGFAARRGQQFRGGSDSPDVRCASLPYHIEVKRVERLNLRDAVAQAGRDATGTPWIVAHRWNHGTWLVTLRATDFLTLAREAPPISVSPAPSCDAGQLEELQPQQPKQRVPNMTLTELYPSRWLKAADVAKPCLATIRGVGIEEVAEGEQKPVLRFTGTLKPMVLNRTNSATIGSLFGDDTDHWTGHQIVLFSTKVQFQSKLVDAIRVRAPKAAPTSASPAPTVKPAASSAPSKLVDEPAAAPVGEDDEVPY